MAINYTCINKNRDNKGKIQTYVLQDDQGNVFEVTGQQIKANMNLKHFNITNLQLDKAGRLVDKAVKVEQTDNVQKALEVAYQMLLQGRDMGFGFININGVTWDLMSEKKIKQILNNSGQTIYPIDFASRFENYVRQLGGVTPCCIYIKSKDGAVEMVNYCINKSEIRLKGFIQEYAGGDKRYLNPNNYIFRAYKLNSPDNSISYYVEPDMSKVGTKNVSNLNLNKDRNESMREQEEHKMTRREFLITLFSSFRNWFK